MVVYAAAVAALVMPVMGEEKAAAAKMPMTGDVEKVSYAIGLNVGEMLVAQETEIDLTAFMAGVSDRMKNATPRINQQQALEVLTKEKQRFADKMQNDARKNKETGTLFLDKNKSKKGVTVTVSGLQYQVVTETTGPKPSLFDTVMFHCKSMFLDGTEFDNTRTRGTPTNRELRQLFKGWQEGMQLMSTGSVYLFYVPSDLAYGRAGNPYLKIGPDMSLIFEIELLSFRNAAAAASPGTTVTPGVQPY